MGTDFSDEDHRTQIQRLNDWDIAGMGLHPGGSNYVFVVRLQDPERPSAEDAEGEDTDDGVYAIYKPVAGERPLRDFPYGTLHQRERAAYLLSRELGWPSIPPTVIRDGPHGEGSVQLFIDADAQANYFTMRDDSLHLFEPMAVFDVLVHNADRKGGSCLKSEPEGQLWSIDHGLTFNHSARRRTVMFEFNGREYSSSFMSDIERLATALQSGDSEFSSELDELLADHERSALLNRAEQMLKSGKFPLLDPDVNVPWPFI